MRRCRGIPEWPLPFCLKAKALNKHQSGKTPSTEQLQYSSCMQQKKEELDPLFYHLPLSRLLNWNRWWHLIAKTVKLVLGKKTWAAIGSHLNYKKGNLSEGIVRLRKLWNSEGRELRRLKYLSGAELECLSP